MAGNTTISAEAPRIPTALALGVCQSKDWFFLHECVSTLGSLVFTERKGINMKRTKGEAVSLPFGKERGITHFEGVIDFMRAFRDKLKEQLEANDVEYCEKYLTQVVLLFMGQSIQKHILGMPLGAAFDGIYWDAYTAMERSGESAQR